MPNQDYFGDDSFQLSIEGKGLTAKLAVQITVVPVNDPPLFTEQSFTVRKNEAFAGKILATDAEGGTITFTVATQSPNGTMTITPDTGDFTFLPNADFTGEAVIAVEATDEDGGKSTGNISITVTP
jgi:hypothetical protein